MDLRDECDDFRGGNGGAGRVLGGESRLMRGGEGLLTKESETCLGVGLGASGGGGLRTIGGFCLGTYGSGPSSTTQSFRSMSEVLRPRFGGDGDGEGGIDFPGVGEGRMDAIEVALGEIGVSRRSGGDLEAMRGPPACMASKALMRAFTAEDAIAAYTVASGRRRREQARTSLPAGAVGMVDAGRKDASNDERHFRPQLIVEGAQGGTRGWRPTSVLGLPSVHHPPTPRTMVDSQLDTQQQLCAATVGFDHLFANDLIKARDTFAGGDSPFHAMGHGVCAFLEAALGMEVRTRIASGFWTFPSLPPTPVGWFDGRRLTPPHRL